MLIPNLIHKSEPVILKKILFCCFRIMQKTSWVIGKLAFCRRHGGKRRVDDFKRQEVFERRRKA